MAIIWAVVLVSALTAHITAPAPDGQEVAVAQLSQPVVEQTITN